jgi:hypothetical protein
MGQISATQYRREAAAPSANSSSTQSAKVFGLDVPPRLLVRAHEVSHDR